MFKKILVSVVTISMLVLAPVVSWGANVADDNYAGILLARSGGAGSGSGSGSDNNTSTEKFLQIQEETMNEGELQQLKVRNEVYGNVSSDDAAVQADRLMDRVQEQLQTLQRDRIMDKDNCDKLNCDLAQLKEQYMRQTGSEVKAQIKNMFKSAYQLAKEQNNTEEALHLLKDMISMDPRDSGNYKELGSMFKNQQQNRYRIFCDGRECQLDVQPVLKEDRTLVPLRAITEGLGAAVQWNETERTVNINKGEDSIVLQIRNRIALVNGNEVELDVPAELNNSRVFVPLRFISQALKADVGYYPQGQIIAVNQ